MPEFKFPCKMFDVESTNVKKIGCDKEFPHATLYVEFNNGAKYKYWFVSKDLWGKVVKAVEGAGSFGSFFHNEIKANSTLKYKPIK